jgi:hypothetical protein
MSSLLHLLAPLSTGTYSQDEELTPTAKPCPEEIPALLEDESVCSDKRSNIRNVSFSPSVVVYDYIQREELTEEERGNAWYNREELQEIHLENVRTVCQMMNGPRPADAVSCARGLEGRTSVGARRRLKNRIDALRVVRDYQLLEVQSGTKHDPVRLAQIYANLTQESARIACLMASIDAHSVAEARTVEPTKRPALICLPRGTPDRRCRHASSSDYPSPIAVRAL